MNALPGASLSARQKEESSPAPDCIITRLLGRDLALDQTAPMEIVVASRKLSSGLKATSYPHKAKAKTQQREGWSDSDQPSLLGILYSNLMF